MCILFFFRVGDINWLWLAGIASIVFLVVFALCLLAKCRVSLFTRHAKRKLRGAGSTRKKSVKKADVKEEKGEEKREEEDGEKKTILPVKEDILSMIDTTLGLVEEGFSGLVSMEEGGGASSRVGRLPPSASHDSIGKNARIVLHFQRPLLFHQLIPRLHFRPYILVSPRGTA